MKFIFYVLGSIVALVLTFSACLYIWGAWHDEWSGYNASLGYSDGSCNIAVIPIAGDIVPFSGVTYEEEFFPMVNPDDVLARIRQAEQDPYIGGVLMRIDSSGVAPVASEIIANALKRTPVPSVALIREMGASGGYLIATGADTIIASPMSDVGGIGVTMSYVENWEQNQANGLSYVSLTSAPFKDVGDPNRPLTREEKQLIERDLEIYHTQFVKEVSENRGLPFEEIEVLADGSSMPGTLALEKKLIDALGDQETARNWFAGQLGLSSEEVVFCE